MAQQITPVDPQSDTGQVSQPPVEEEPLAPAEKDTGLTSPLPPGALATTTPESEPTGRFGAIQKGLQKAWGEELPSSLAASGEGHPTPPTPSQPSWLERPITENWHLWDQGIPKLLYQYAESSPEIAAAVVGGLVGKATGPFAPIAAPVFSGLAAGGMSYLKHMGPYYSHELMATPNDRQGAWDRAEERAKQDGALTGLAYGIFGAFNPLSTIARNYALHAGVTQPAVSMAEQAKENVRQGKSFYQDFIPAYFQGVTAGAVAPATHAVGGGLGWLAKRLVGIGATASETSGPSSLADMVKAKNAHYAPLDNAGPIPNQEAVKAKSEWLKQELFRIKADPRYPEFKPVFDQAEHLLAGRGGAPIDLADIMNLRHSYSDMAWESWRDPVNARAARHARDLVDSFLSPKGLQEFGYSPEEALSLGENYALGKQYHHDAEVLGTIERLKREADVAGNPETARISKFRALYQSHAFEGIAPVLQDMIKGLIEPHEGQLKKIGAKVPPLLSTGGMMAWLMIRELKPEAAFPAMLAGIIPHVMHIARNMNNAQKMRDITSMAQWLGTYTPEGVRAKPPVMRTGPQPPPTPYTGVPPTSFVPMAPRPAVQGPAQPEEDYSIFRSRGGALPRALRVARQLPTNRS